MDYQIDLRRESIEQPSVSTVTVLATFHFIMHRRRFPQYLLTVLILSYTGGALLIVVDLQGISEYIKINPLPRHFDSVYELLVESDIFARDTTERCDVEFTLTKRNLQVVLSTDISDNVEFCSSESVRIAEALNNPNRYTTFLPELLQFTSAAVVVAPLVENVATNIVTVTEHSGAMSVAATTATIIIYAAMTAILQ